MALALAPMPASGQGDPDDRPRRPSSDAYAGGDAIRFSLGRSAPHGGLPHWDSGNSYALTWESWEPGRSAGAGRTAAGLSLTYTRLPFLATEFLQSFQTTS